MWPEITAHLYEFESAVLSGLDEEGYPFLVRGVLFLDIGEWCFEPVRFIPGLGMGGLPGMMRFFVRSRRNARRYLEKRGLARPRIPWDEINAAKKEAFASTAGNRLEANG
jgi:hypothetical protein